MNHKDCQQGELKISNIQYYSYQIFPLKLHLYNIIKMLLLAGLHIQGHSEDIYEFDGLYPLCVYSFL